MGVLGVKLVLILAAATTTLPLTPPAGWTRVPAPAVKAQIYNGWYSPPLANGKRAAFATALFPWPGSAQLLSRNGTPITVCGQPARLVEYRTGSGSDASIVQQVVIAKGGYASTLLYTRPANTSADPNVIRAMRTVCATGTPSLPALQLPKGWTRKSPPSAMESLGRWVGKEPGEVMTLSRTGADVSIAKLADQLHDSVKASSAKQYVKAFKQQPATFCGKPGLIITMDMGVPSLPMVIEQAVTQSGGVSYMLGYVRPASDPNSAAAEASLRTLCATTASQ